MEKQQMNEEDINVFDVQSNDELYTEAEAAKILKIGQSTLQRKRLNSEIEFYRIGGQVRYSLRQINEYLQRCKISV